MHFNKLYVQNCSNSLNKHLKKNTEPFLSSRDLKVFGASRTQLPQRSPLAVANRFQKVMPIIICKATLHVKVRPWWKKSGTSGWKMVKDRAVGNENWMWIDYIHIIHNTYELHSIIWDAWSVLGDMSPTPWVPWVLPSINPTRWTCAMHLPSASNKRRPSP